MFIKKVGGCGQTLLDNLQCHEFTTDFHGLVGIRSKIAVVIGRRPSKTSASEAHPVGTLGAQVHLGRLVEVRVVRVPNVVPEVRLGARLGVPYRCIMCND